MNTMNTSDITNIHEEKEVDISNNQNNVTDVVNVSKKSVNVPIDFNDIVPVEERVVEVGSVEYSGAKEAGYFTQAYGMAQIVERCDGRIYAGIWEEASGKKLIKFCIKDNLGNYSTVITMRQAEFIMAMNYNFNTNKNSNDNDEDIPLVVKNIVNKFITNFTLDYLDRVPVSLHVKPELILNTIALNIDALPCHVYNNGMSNAEAIYSEIMKYSNTYYNEQIYGGIFSHKAYYSFSICEIEGISRHLEISSKELLGILKDNNLLYLQPSSKGFQTKVNACGTLEYCYCIKKLEIMNIKKDSSESSN